MNKDDEMKKDDTMNECNIKEEDRVAEKPDTMESVQDQFNSVTSGNVHISYMYNNNSNCD